MPLIVASLLWSDRHGGRLQRPDPAAAPARRRTSRCTSGCCGRAIITFGLMIVYWCSVSTGCSCCRRSSIGLATLVWIRFIRFPPYFARVRAPAGQAALLHPRARSRTRRRRSAVADVAPPPAALRRRVPDADRGPAVRGRAPAAGRAAGHDRRSRARPSRAAPSGVHRRARVRAAMRASRRTPIRGLDAVPRDRGRRLGGRGRRADARDRRRGGGLAAGRAPRRLDRRLPDAGDRGRAGRGPGLRAWETVPGSPPILRDAGRRSPEARAGWRRGGSTRIATHRMAARASPVATARPGRGGPASTASPGRRRRATDARRRAPAATAASQGLAAPSRSPNDPLDRHEPLERPAFIARSRPRSAPARSTRRLNRRPCTCPAHRLRGDRRLEPVCSQSAEGTLAIQHGRASRLLASPVRRQVGPTHGRHRSLGRPPVTAGPATAGSTSPATAARRSDSALLRGAS